MRKFRVVCTQITGKGRLLFNYNQEPTEDQLDNVEHLLKDGAIVEIIEPVIDEKSDNQEPTEDQRPKKVKINTQK